MSFEGSAVSTRNSVNLAFYGRPVTAADLILEETLPLPVAAAPLYAALDQLLTCVGAAQVPRYPLHNHPCLLYSLSKYTLDHVVSAARSLTIDTSHTLRSLVGY